MTKVTIGLINGESRSGSIERFDPGDGQVSVRLAQTRQGSRNRQDWTTFSPENIAYIAFHKGDEDAAPDGEQMSEYVVHMLGDDQFVVRAREEKIDNRLGFFGFPMSDYSWFSRIFFYQHGTRAIEHQQPFGSLLVDSGLVRRDELESGLTKQAELRNARIGDILVEQGVPSESVEAAVVTQELSEVSEVAAEESEVEASRRRMRLGEVLVESGLATDEQIEAALDEQKRRKGLRLGEVLVKMGLVGERDISEALADKFNLEFVDLTQIDIQAEAIEEVPEEVIERFGLLPIRSTDDELVLAMSDPLAMDALDLLRFSLDKNIREVVATPSQIDELLQPYLSQKDRSRRADQLEQLLDEMHDDARAQSDQKNRDVTVAGEAEGVVAKLVNRIIIDAYRRGASDIHIEPNGPDDPVLVRFRIDGVCETYRELPSAHRAPLVARIKIMANLDITERRKPQDGKIKLKLDEQDIELRVATVPTVHRDEDVVLRILAGGEPMPIDQLALSPRNLAVLRDAVQRPYGLILAVGPTGSGKTTTLHALLGSINTVERKIWTAEDPVEITQAGLRQVQVQPKIDFGFAEALRSFLRADPDVIMVGEMRDHETAHIGVEASLTGHLVFSTLHTNSAPETITRLIDMGLDAFSFSDALIAVVAQRLARRLCPACRHGRDATAEERDELVELYGQGDLGAYLDGEPLRMWEAKGCQLCDHKGYKGRVGIHEVLVNDEKLRGAIQQNEPVDKLRALARDAGMRTLVEDGVEKCLDGTTDLRQVLAVCGR